MILLRSKHVLGRSRGRGGAINSAVRIMLLSAFINFLFHPQQTIISFHNIQLVLKENNHLSKLIKSAHKRRFILSCKNLNNLRFLTNLFGIFIAMLLITWLISLILCCGDIHPNPGPLSSSSSSSNTSISSVSLSSYESHLSVCHLNIQSILPKIDILQHEMQAFDVYVFTETWLNDGINDSQIKVVNFNDPFRCDRDDRSGGVAIYVNENLNATRRRDLELNGLECVWIQLKLRGHDILICGMYRPPDAINWNLIHESVDRAKSTHIQDIIIIGDLNNDLLVTNRCKHLQELMNTYNLKQLIDEPTHFTELSSTLIDVILVNKTSNILASDVCDPFIPNLIRFHCPIAVILKFLKPKRKCYTRKIWKYDQGDYTKYRQLLSMQSWDDILLGDVDTVANKIASTVMDAASKSIPNKNVTIRPKDTPWLHNEIRNLIRRRKRIHRRAKLLNTIEAWAKFRKIRNKIVGKIRSAKSDYENRISAALQTNTTDIKTWWKLSKQVLNLEKGNEPIPDLKHDNTIIESDQEKAEIFNEFFITQSRINDANKMPPNLPEPTYDRLRQINISATDVCDILKSLNVSKASGPDLVSPRLLKEGANQLCTPLSTFFNRLLISGQYPKAWKYADVTPVYKKGDKQIPNNYRPISLLSVVGKTMERSVHKYVYNYCAQHRVFTPFQSGFIQGDSTTYQLINLYDTFCEAVDNGKEVRVVFLDISKAFDRVWHRGLLHKLHSIGISGHLLKWFENYLSDRVQRVVINGKASSYLKIPAGVPQGSILGPLLFLIYINDIVLELDCCIRLFADDTSLYIVVENPNTSAILLNSSISTIHSWAEDWLVDFSAPKTDAMVITRKRIKPNHPPLIMDNVVITEVDRHRHLGITFSSDLNWQNHITEIKTKAWQRLNILRAFKFKFDRRSLERMYVSFIRPTLEYSGAVWDNCNDQDKKLLENIQIEAMRIVTGATKLCSISKLYQDTGWETLEARRRKQKLIIFFKMIHGLCPDYLNELVPETVQNRARYPLRNADNISTIRTNSVLYYESFLPSAIRAWNDLPNTIRNSTSLIQFKRKLSEQRSKPPNHFYYGRRVPQIQHARLRMECSALQQHLFKKSLVESPLCTCGISETSKHFLLDCQNYHQIRNRTLSDFLHLPTKSLLFGDPRLTEEENTNIFEAVHKFITQTGRFDN